MILIGQTTSWWGVKLMSVPFFYFTVLLKCLWSFTRDCFDQHAPTFKGILVVCVRQLRGAISLIACSENHLCMLHTWGASNKSCWHWSPGSALFDLKSTFLSIFKELNYIFCMYLCDWICPTVEHLHAIIHSRLWIISQFNI